LRYSQKSMLFISNEINVKTSINRQINKNKEKK